MLDDNYIATGSNDCTAKVVDLRTLKACGTIKLKEKVNQVQF